MKNVLALVLGFVMGVLLVLLYLSSLSPDFKGDSKYRLKIKCNVNNTKCIKMIERRLK